LNINGIGVNDLSNGFTLMYEHMKATGTAIGMFAETNVDWKNHQVREANEQHGRTAFPNAISAFSCHNEGTGGQYQPGGTMTTMNGAIATRHLESGHDPTGMGRYTYQSIMGQNNTRIMFITAYRVCFQSISSAGTQTSHFQQWHHLRTEGHQNPNPRKQILEDLKTFIHECIKEGCDVCLAMDANEDTDSRHQKINTFAGECGLVNAHELFFDDDFYDDNPLPATCNKGSKKIDHMFCTPRLFDCIVAVAIEPLSAGIKSDHRALIVDFDSKAMLGGNMPHITKNSTRILKSYSKKASRNYRNELDNRLAVQNVYERVEKIIRKFKRKQSFDKKMHNNVEAIDQYITKCMLKCERLSNTANGEEFSPKKIKAANISKFWALALSAMKNDLTTPTPPMMAIMERYPETEFSQYNDNEVIYERIKECMETTRQTKDNAHELRQAFLTERAEIANLLRQQSAKYKTSKLPKGTTQSSTVSWRETSSGKASQ
jgi:hypothetical protein